MYDQPGQLKLRQHGKPQTSSKHNRAFKPSFNGSKVKHSEYAHFKEYDDKTYHRRQGPNDVKCGP